MMTHNVMDDRRVLVREALETLMRAAPTEDGSPARPVLIDFDDQPDNYYLHALVDLLGFLGAVRLSRDRLMLEVPTVQAGYLCRLLADLLTADAPLIPDWSGEGVTRGAFLDIGSVLTSGVNLLAALEHRRLTMLPEAEPLREVRAALGLLTRTDLGERTYLLVYDAVAGAWQLPGGRFEQRDGSLRLTLLRELSEEFDCGPLQEPHDVTLAELSAPISVTRFSPTYGLLTRTCFQFYAVQLKRALPPSFDLRWFTADELRAGQSSNGARLAAEPLLELSRQLGVSVDVLPTA